MKKTLMIAALMLASCVASAAEAVKITFELSKNDKVVNSASIPTLDGKAVDYRLGDEIAYIQDSEQSGDILTVTPGKVETGLTINALPKITKEGKVTLTIAGSHVDLIKMDKKPVENSTAVIESPDVDDHKIELLFTAKNGEEQKFFWTSPKTNSRYVLTFTTSIVDNPTVVSR